MRFPGLQCLALVLAASVAACAPRTVCMEPCEAEVTTGYVNVGPDSLYFERTGRGPSVVLIHGSNLDLRMWDDQMPVLTPEFRVLRYDLAAFGRSSRPSTPFAAHEQLLVLLDGLSIRQAALVGLSAGGRIAIDFALTYPDRVSALVLASAGASGASLGGASRGPWVGEMMRAIQARDTIGATEAWLKSPMMTPAMSRPELAERVRALTHANSGIFAMASNPERALDPPAYGRLEEIRAPTLVIIGEADAPELRALADTLASRIPGAEKVVLPGAGHLTNLEAPEAFNNAVLEFLRTALLETNR